MDIYHTAQQAKIDSATDTQCPRHQTHRTTAIANFVVVQICWITPCATVHRAA
ncbi:hypothetical protein ACLBOM_07560 [Escherichia coli]